MITNPNIEVKIFEQTLKIPKVNYLENLEMFGKILTAEDLLSIKSIPRPEPLLKKE